MKEKSGIWKKYFRMLLDAGLPWGLMVICFALAMLTSQLTLTFANKLGTTLVPYDDMSQAIGPLAVLFALGIGNIIVKVVSAWLQGIVTAQVDRNLQKHAVKKVFYLKTSDVEKGDPREMITRLTEDTSKSSVFLVDLMINEIPRLYYMVMAIIQVIALKRPILIVCTLAVIPIVLLGSIIGGKLTFNNRNAIQQKIAVLTARLAEKIDNIEIIKAYHTEEKEILSGNEVIDELDKVKKQGVLVDQINAFIKNMMWFLPLLVIIIPPALLLFKGEMTQGDFYAYILIVTTFRSKAEEHLTLWIYLKEAQGASLRLSEILNMKSEKEIKGAVPQIGDLHFDHVSFSYDDKKVLDDVSFTIPQGKKTALVGLSGSGKSTMLNLIEKFYEPQKGRILLNGQNIAEADCQKYRKMFAYLPQNAAGFHGTVKDMLLLSCGKDINDEKLKEVLKQVELPELDLDYDVGYEGEKLSGGQRQKLGIARLLLSDAEYFLLDEATSALDAEATDILQKRIDEKTSGRTQIVVAHDLSTIVNADKIMLFDNGRLSAEGTHEELLKKSELYRQLTLKEAN